MGKYKPYTPEIGSFAHEVIEFFTTNPDEELTTNDMQVKFDRPTKQVHSLLALAVDAGVLVRFENDDGDVAYRLETGVRNIVPRPISHPSWLSSMALPAKRTKANSVAVDISAVQLRDAVPLPSAQSPKHNWSSLLERMQVGQSCELPIVLRASVNKAVTKRKQRGLPGQFALRQTSDTTFGLWRAK